MSCWKLIGLRRQTLWQRLTILNDIQKIYIPLCCSSSSSRWRRVAGNTGGPLLCRTKLLFRPYQGLGSSILGGLHWLRADCLNPLLMLRRGRKGQGRSRRQGRALCSMCPVRWRWKLTICVSSSCCWYCWLSRPMMWLDGRLNSQWCYVLRLPAWSGPVLPSVGLLNRGRAAHHCFLRGVTWPVTVPCP